MRTVSATSSAGRSAAAPSRFFLWMNSAVTPKTTSRDLSLTDCVEADFVPPCGSFIMSWIIERAKKAADIDLRIPLPKAVEGVIAAYHEENDRIGYFLEERCEIAEDASEKPEELYQK